MQPENSSSQMLKTTSLLTFLFIIANIFFWYYAQQVLKDPYTLFSNPSNYLLHASVIGISFVFILATTALSGVLVKNTYYRWGLLLINVIGPAFLPFPSLINTLVILLYFCAFLLFDWMVQYDLSIHTVPNLFHILTPRMSFFVRLLSLALSVIIFQASSENLAQLDLKIPTNLVDSAVSLSQPIISEKINFEQDKLYEDAISQLNLQIPALNSVSDESKRELLNGVVTEDVRAALLDQGLSDQQINQFSESIAAQIPQSNDSVLNEEFTTDFVQNLKDETKLIAERLFEENKHFAPWVISVIFFLLFNSLEFIVYYAAIFITIVSLTILQQLNWVDLVTFTRQVKEYRIRTQ